MINPSNPLYDGMHAIFDFGPDALREAAQGAYKEGSPYNDREALIDAGQLTPAELEQVGQIAADWFYGSDTVWDLFHGFIGDAVDYVVSQRGAPTTREKIDP